MRNLLPILVTIFLIINSCATSGSYSILADQSVEAPRELIIPAGVDSITAKESRQIADSTFVSYQREQEAAALVRRANAYRAESDTLWNLLTLNIEDNTDVNEDSPEFIELYNQGADILDQIGTIQQQSNISQEDIERYSMLVNQAINSFEEALILNPFDIQTRTVLGQLYGIKADRLNREEDHLRAIDVLEKLARIEQGEHVIYSALAENYFKINSFENAANNFNLARDALETSVLLTDYYYDHNGMSPQDSSNVFLYTYYIGESHLNLFDAESALNAFYDARDLASSDEDVEIIDSQISFINWDDGNILGSMRRDSLALLVANDQLEDAESGFIKLLNSLKTEKAQDEIEWRLGVVQYQMGKQDAAATRLLNLVERIEILPDGSAVNSEYTRYLNDFGTITYNMGIEYRRNNERNLALKYLNQSTKFKWNDRARSYLQIADLIGNNREESIRYALLAEEEVESLNESEKKSLYELLADLYRRSRNSELAQHYFQLWREI